MYKILPLLLLFVINQPLRAQNEPFIAKRTDFPIGETIEFQSTILNEKRIVNIYLPNGYHPDSLKKYPVIYLLDGSVDEDFIHISGLVQFGSFSWINMLPETIVVGIANVDRRRDFTYPTNNKKDKADFPTTGGSEKFIAFLEQELQPFVEKTYKTDLPRTIIGQSLGGLLATEILFKKPDLFDHYLIVSPSLWWDDQSLLKYPPKAFSTPKAIYIGVGKEGRVMERDAKALYKKLKKSRLESTKLFFNFFKKQNHGDALHLAAYDGFEKIYRKAKK